MRKTLAIGLALTALSQPGIAENIPMKAVTVAPEDAATTEDFENGNLEGKSETLKRFAKIYQLSKIDPRVDRYTSEECVIAQMGFRHEPTSEAMDDIYQHCFINE